MSLSKSLKNRTMRFLYALRFKFLNINSTKNYLYLAPDIGLKVHEKSYYPFRYFTDFDNEMVEEMLSFIKLTRSSRCLIDVGAHYGVFSLVFSSRPNSYAFALEPSSSAFDILTKNINLNPQCNITAHQVCASHSLEAVRMSISNADHFVADSSNSSQAVDTITLDNFCSNEKLIPDTLKIDVEGFELSVLQGAQQLISTYSPLIFLEIHPQELLNYGGSVRQVIDLLSSLDYIFLDSKNKIINDQALSKQTEVIRILCKKRTK